MQLYHGFHCISITESFRFYSQDLCFPLTHTPLGKFASSLFVPSPVWGLWMELRFFLPVSLMHIKVVRLHTDRRIRERKREHRGDLISWMYFCFHIHSHAEERHTASSLHTIHSSTVKHMSTHTHNLYQNVAT